MPALDPTCTFPWSVATGTSQALPSWVAPSDLPNRRVLSPRISPRLAAPPPLPAALQRSKATVCGPLDCRVTYAARPGRSQLP